MEGNCYEVSREWLVWVLVMFCSGNDILELKVKE